MDHELYMRRALELAREAAAAGVQVVAYTCRVTPTTLEIDTEIPVIL